MNLDKDDYTHCFNSALLRLAGMLGGLAKRSGMISREASLTPSCDSISAPPGEDGSGVTDLATLTADRGAGGCGLRGGARGGASEGPPALAAFFGAGGGGRG